MLSNLHLSACMLRYVDNRLIVVTPSFSDLAPFPVLLDPGFYGPFIILEEEPGQEFLGFKIELDPFEIQYNPPTSINQIIFPFSASPPSILHNRFLSRAHIISRGAFPQSQVFRGLDALTALYKKAGYHADDLHKLRARVDKKTA